MPILPPSHRPDPKSALRAEPAPAWVIQAAELGWGSSPVTSDRQNEVAGVSVQLPGTPGIGTKQPDAARMTPPTRAATPRRRRDRFDGTWDLVCTAGLLEPLVARRPPPL